MTDSIFMQAMEAIRDRIRLLALTGLSDDRVQVRRMPHDAGGTYFPGITVHPVTETYESGTNMRENVGLGCGITMCVNCDDDSDFLLDRLLLWRETIRQHFVEDDGLPPVANSCSIKIEHGHPLVWDELVNRHYDISRLVARVYTLQSRT